MLCVYITGIVMCLYGSVIIDVLVNNTGIVVVCVYVTEIIVVSVYSTQIFVVCECSTGIVVVFRMRFLL